MSLIETLVVNTKKEQKKNWYIYLSIEKFLVEKHFNWLNLEIDTKNKSLCGKGILNIESKKYEILLSYSPFYRYRYDRIYIKNIDIKYNNDIHVYGDISLCLYHPIFDKPLFKTIHLYKMIPWITEWVIFYEQWKKYGVWFGKEIKH
ncbi:hypothetical protein [Myroides odoratimimus]|uniref:hypothetical protein n=1 Tax=Myroides odoratimimus TaxID=76832 RepID=UPI0031013B8E